MNAGSSRIGTSFAAKNADIAFVGFHAVAPVDANRSALSSGAAVLT
jgi:hypothetical protein